MCIYLLCMYYNIFVWAQCALAAAAAATFQRNFYNVYSFSLSFFLTLFICLSVWASNTFCWLNEKKNCHLTAQSSCFCSMCSQKLRAKSIFINVYTFEISQLCRWFVLICFGINKYCFFWKSLFSFCVFIFRTWQ